MDARKTLTIKEIIVRVVVAKLLFIAALVMLSAKVDELNNQRTAFCNTTKCITLDGRCIRTSSNGCYYGMIVYTLIVGDKNYSSSMLFRSNDVMMRPICEGLDQIYCKWDRRDPDGTMTIQMFTTNVSDWTFGIVGFLLIAEAIFIAVKTLRETIFQQFDLSEFELPTSST